MHIKPQRMTLGNSILVLTVSLTWHISLHLIVPSSWPSLSFLFSLKDAWLNFFKAHCINKLSVFSPQFWSFYYCYHKKINISIFRKLFIEAQRNVDIQLHLQKYSCPSWQFQKSSDRPKAEHNRYSTLYNISPISFSSLFSPGIPRFKQWISLRSQSKKPKKKTLPCPLHCSY